MVGQQKDIKLKSRSFVMSFCGIFTLRGWGPWSGALSLAAWVLVLFA